MITINTKVPKTPAIIPTVLSAFDTFAMGGSFFSKKKKIIINQQINKL